MNWRDVFDGNKFRGLNGRANIIDLNKFLYDNTTYGYFGFNGIVFSVHFPSQFTDEEIQRGYKVGIKVEDLRP